MLGPKQGYVEILNYFTQQKLNEEANRPRKYNPLRPSSAGKDARELAYEYMEYKGYASYGSEPIDPDLDRLFKLGHTIEKSLLYQFQDALKLSGGDLELRYQQQTLSFFQLHDGTQIEGSCDAVFLPRTKAFGGGVMDVKSKKDKFHSYFKTDWDGTSDKFSNMRTVQKFGEESFWIEDLEAFLLELDDYFFAMNFKQLNMYFFDEHKFLRERGVDHGVIIQYAKNDSRVREIRFKPSEKIYQQVKDKFLLVAKTVDETKDPTQVPRENVLGSAAVAFSKYRKIDYPDADAMKAYFNTWPKKQWPRDTNRLESGKTLDGLFSELEAARNAADEAERVEQQIVTILEKEQEEKIKTSTGEIYQMKYLKSAGVGGKGGYVVRRTKL